LSFAISGSSTVKSLEQRTVEFPRRLTFLTLNRKYKESIKSFFLIAVLLI
jgi:hypothetical protein